MVRWLVLVFMEFWCYLAHKRFFLLFLLASFHYLLSILLVFYLLATVNFVGLLLFFFGIISCRFSLSVEGTLVCNTQL